MKKYLFLAFCLLLVACTKGKNDSPVIYDNSNISVKLNKTVWYTTINKNNDSLYFGNIHLRIEGSTNSDSIFIKTFGDGVIGWQSILPDSNKSFTYDAVISFLPVNHNPKGDETSSGTTLQAFKGTETFDVGLNSGKLVY